MAPHLNRSAQRAALLELGALMAREMKAGRGGDGTRMVGEALGAMPQATLEVMALIEKESRKKRPDAYLLAALAHMAGQALEQLRYGIERADPAAEATLDAARQQLVAHARSDRVDPNMLLVIARQFATAKLDIGETLRDALGQLVAERAAGVEDEDEDGFDMERRLVDLATEFGDDVFAIHMELAETAASLPSQHRIGMAGVMLGSASQTIRQVALGWLFDADAETRAAVADLLADRARAGELDGATLSRLVGSRNWLPAAERARIDECVRVGRRKGAEPPRAPDVRVLEILASAFDGSGAGTVVVLVKLGRRYGVASVLFKLGIGVRDAWVRRDLAKAEALHMMETVASDMDVVAVPKDYVGRALQHFIGLQVAAGAPPPFGVLGAVELLGLGPINPSVLAPDEILAALLADRQGATPEKALADSADWPERFGFMDSWFEDDAAVEAALKGRKGLSRARRIDLVLDLVVAPRRRRWAEILAWTAWVTAESAHGTDDAVALALVARELLGERPAAEIPLLREIASATVEARRLRRS